MGQSYSKLTSNAMLLFSSSICLNYTPGAMRYARYAFKLYFISSVVGTLASFLGSPFLEDLNEMVWVWSYIFGIPLLSSDLCVFSQYMPNTAPLHLAIPLYSIAVYYLHPDSVDPLLLSISHSLSIIFLAICSANEGYINGFALAFLHFFIMWRMGADDKSHIDWAMNMTMSNFLALNTIEWVFEDREESD